MVDEVEDDDSVAAGSAVVVVVDVVEVWSPADSVDVSPWKTYDTSSLSSSLSSVLSYSSAIYSEFSLP